MIKECRFCKNWGSSIYDEPCVSCVNLDYHPNYIFDDKALDGGIDVVKLSTNFSKKVVNSLLTNYILKKLGLSVGVDVKDLEIKSEGDIFDINASINLKILKDDVGKMVIGGEKNE